MGITTRLCYRMLNFSISSSTVVYLLLVRPYIRLVERCSRQMLCIVTDGGFASRAAGGSISAFSLLTCDDR